MDVPPGRSMKRKGSVFSSLMAFAAPAAASTNFCVTVLFFGAAFLTPEPVRSSSAARVLVRILLLLRTGRPGPSMGALMELRRPPRKLGEGGTRTDSEVMIVSPLMSIVELRVLDCGVLGSFGIVSRVGVEGLLPRADCRVGLHRSVDGRSEHSPSPGDAAPAAARLCGKGALTP